MSDCWKEDPSSRPSFSELIDTLEVIMAKDVPYCDLSKQDKSSEYYNVPVDSLWEDDTVLHGRIFNKNEKL